MTVEFHRSDFQAVAMADAPREGVFRAMRNGFRRRCPRCGTGKIFSGLLKVRPSCSDCGLELHHHRADDLPPYLTIVIVGHVVVGSMLAGRQVLLLPETLQYVLWPGLALFMALALLSPIKGAVIGLQWALKMHGFGLAQD